MALILDADSLIKLNRVGALELVARAFECVVPEAVYREAVVNARAKGYADAEEIDSIIQDVVRIQQVALALPSTSSRALGAGEIEVLALGMQNAEESIIVSDDQAFLHAVQENGIRYLIPIALIPVLARSGSIRTDVAREMVERSRSLTNERNYFAALADLEALEK